MNKVNAFMNQKGDLFQYALVEKTITTGLTQVQADLMRTGARPVPRGQAPQPRPLTPPNYPAPEPPAPNYQAPLPPMRPDGLRKPLPKMPPRKF